MKPVHTPRWEAGALCAERYRLIRVRGKGAIGVVWEAEDVVLGRRVALKLLRETAVDRDGVRFEREARAASRIDHPNVVRVLDFGATPDGVRYLTMELLAGRTLERLIRRHGRFGIGEVCELLRPIARALDAAHAQGVVHRDVKPGNIVCAETESGARMTLLDFGLAALYEASCAPRVTEAGTLVGTPAYAAPECALDVAIDARADVYSLAVIAFEMLTGRLPHVRDSVIGTITAKLTEPAPRLSDTAGARFDEALEDVIARALSIDRAVRPASAGELVRALVRAAEGRSLRPAPKRTLPAPKKRRSHGLAFAVIATLLIAGLTAWAASDASGERNDSSVRRADVVGAAHAREGRHRNRPGDGGGIR